MYKSNNKKSFEPDCTNFFNIIGTKGVHCHVAMFRFGKRGVSLEDLVRPRLEKLISSILRLYCTYVEGWLSLVI
jgi:hypothetical protein